MKNKTLLVLMSAAGFKNYGDEKILLKWMSFYKIYKHLDYVLIHGMSHDLVVMYNDDPQIRYQFPVHTLDDDCLDKVLCLCDSYDLVIIHITGGGFMNDKFKGNHGISIFQQIFRFILGVRSKFKQTVLIGTGLSLYPLNIGSAKLIKKNDDFKFQYCSFRDEVTSYYFQANGSPLYGDDLLNVLFLPLERRSIKRRLLVNIQNQFEITAYI